MKTTRRMLPASRNFAIVCAQARRGITLWYYASALLLAGVSGSAFSAPQGLLKPTQLIVDSSLPPATHAANGYVARQYATFRNTGDEALARTALAGNFIDKTPPEGRQQGPRGVILASGAFRQVVPDLRCDIEQMIVAGNRVVSHLHFHGHFAGTFDTREDKGQDIDLITADIYQINDGKIAADWHIEDSLTLMKQLDAQ